MVNQDCDMEAVENAFWFQWFPNRNVEKLTTGNNHKQFGFFSYSLRI